MTKLRWTLFASLFIFAISAGVQAEGLPYNLSDLTGDCYFDGGTPLNDGDILARNTKISMGGDGCIGFEIWVGPLDGSAADMIPRAEVYSWQQCRFSNVMTQNKIDEYALAYAEGDEETVRFWGVCGQFVDPDPDSDPAPEQDGIFVPDGYATRVLQVDTD